MFEHFFLFWCNKLFNIKIFDRIKLQKLYTKFQYKLNKNKPTTENNIPAKILIENAVPCAPIITQIYNNSVTEGNFPSALKDADITPGHKKEEKTFKGNYRPVSVLPTVSKIFERNMYKDIDTYMLKFLSPKLCGFRKG